MHGFAFTREPSTQLARFSFPCVDFTGHPYYRDLVKSATPEFRRRNFAKFYRVFKGLVEQQSAFLQLREEYAGETVPAKSPELEALKSRGIVTLRLRPDDRNRMQTLLRPAEERLEQQRQGIAPNSRGVAASVIPVCQIEKQDEYHTFFERLAIEYGILDLCFRYKGVPYELKSVALQHNTSDDGAIARICSYEDGARSRSYYAHIDSYVEHMKVIVYVTPEVTGAQGAFRYFIGSHNNMSLLDLGIRKANDRCGWENPRKVTDRASFAALPREFQMKANFGNDLLDDAVVDGLLAYEEVFESKDGDILFFDPDGAHRGAIFTQNGERKILQFSLRPRFSHAQ